MWIKVDKIMVYNIIQKWGGHTSCWAGLEVARLHLWWTEPAVWEESHFWDRAECLLLSPGVDLIALNTPQPWRGAPSGKRERPASCMSKHRAHAVDTHTLCILRIQTLFCSSSAFRLSRLLKMRSFCSSLSALLINLKTTFLSASKCCQEPRVALRW